MGTQKRERQRQNRLKRVVADEMAARQALRRRRLLIAAAAAALLALALGGVAVVDLIRGSDDADDAIGEALDQDRARDGQPADDASGGAADSASAGSPEPTATTAQDADADNATQHDDTTDAETAGTTGRTTSDRADARPGCPAPDGSSGQRLDFDDPQPDCIDASEDYAAVFDTSEGVMRFDLHTQRVPITVNNFVTLARWGYYDDTLLFRTDPSIDIIQGGSPRTNSPSDPGPGYTIPDEPAFTTDPATNSPVGPYRYQPGQLVMARSAGRDSAGAQFFITTGPNSARLDSQGTYVVFGETDADGLGVAQSIIGLHEPGGSLGGAPSREVAVHSVTIEQPSQ